MPGAGTTLPGMSDPVPLCAARAAAARLLGRWQQFPEVLRLCPAGALRRMQPRVDALRILLTSFEPEALRARLRAEGYTAGVGPEDLCGRTPEGLAVDVRVMAEAPAAAARAWLEETGPPAHVEALCARALTLGLARGPNGRPAAWAAAREESDLYRALGLAPVPPERRDRPLDEVAPDDLCAMEHARGLFLAPLVGHGGRLAAPALLALAADEGYGWVVLAERWPGCAPAGSPPSPEAVVARRAEIAALAPQGPRPFLAARLGLQATADLDRRPDLAAAYDLLVLEPEPTGRGDTRPDRGALEAALAHPRVAVLASPPAGAAWAGDPAVQEDLIAAAAAHGKALEVGAAPTLAPPSPGWHAGALALGVRAVAGARVLAEADLDQARCALGFLRAGGWPRERVLTNLDAPAAQAALGGGRA